MLRIIYAAIAGGLALQLWSVISAALLPWPQVVVPGPLPPPPLTASVSIPADGGEGEPFETELAPTNPIAPSNVTPASGTPPSAFTRIPGPQLDVDARFRGLAIDLVIGLLAAVAILALPEQTHWSRRVALLIIAGAIAILVGDLNQAATMQWPLRYSLVLCVDHFLAVLCVAGASSLIMFWKWPLQLPARWSRPGRPSLDQQ